MLLIDSLKPLRHRDSCVGNSKAPKKTGVFFLYIVVMNNENGREYSSGAVELCADEYLRLEALGEIVPSYRNLLREAGVAEVDIARQCTEIVVSATQKGAPGVIDALNQVLPGILPLERTQEPPQQPARDRRPANFFVENPNSILTLKEGEEYYIAPEPWSNLRNFKSSGVKKGPGRYSSR